MPKQGPEWIAVRPYFSITLLIFVMTMLLQPFGLAFDLVNIALIYLLPVVISAAFFGLAVAFYAAILGVLAFDFFFVSPVLSFTVADLRYLISFAVYLTVAALTASLAARLKQQVHYSKQKEAHTAALYSLSRQMSAITDISSLLDNFSLQVSQTLNIETAVYLMDDHNHLVLVHCSKDLPCCRQEDEELSIAKRVYGQAKSAGIELFRINDSPVFFLKLQTEEHAYGMTALYPQPPISGITAEQKQLLEALSGLVASAIDHAKLAEEAKIAQITAESEKIRTAILNSVSHELRTPLAAIIGSATSLVEGEHLFSSKDRMDLLFTIRDGALRMNRLVKNLLSMVQLESGMLRLRKNWVEIGDLIGVTFSQVKDFQQHRKLLVDIPYDEPIIIQGDEVLLEQVLVNVVSNSIKYSPDYSEIILTVRSGENAVVITVSDNGMGLHEEEHNRIFDKFYRSDKAKQITGTGLGLAICKGIVDLHHGTITAKPNQPQGTVITITLPLHKHDRPF